MLASELRLVIWRKVDCHVLSANWNNFVWYENHSEKKCHLFLLCICVTWWLWTGSVTSSSILIFVLLGSKFGLPVSWRSDRGTCRESLLRVKSFGCWFWTCLLSWFFEENPSLQPETLHGKYRPSACRWMCRLSWASSLKNVGQRLQAYSPRGAIWVLIMIPCVPKWWLSCVTVWNFFGHWLQTYCWILWCVFIWLLRLVTWAKDLPQFGSIQTKGRSPVWRRRWLFRFVIWVNALPQSILKYQKQFQPSERLGILFSYQT